MKMRQVQGSGLFARGSWYVLQNALGPMRSIFIYSVLLLESVRLKLEWNVAIHQPHPFSATLKFLGQWLPLYSALGIQLALAMGVMFGMAKISRSRELDALHALGFSTLQLLAPILAVGVIVASFVFFILGWVQPLGFYYSKIFLHEVQMTASLMADGENLFRVQNGKTFIVEGISNDGRQFKKFFIYDPTNKAGQETAVVTAGSNGSIVGEGSISTQSYAVNAMDVMEMKATDNAPLSNINTTTTSTSLANVHGPINAVEDKGYQQRGENEIEWTLPELMSGGPDIPFKLSARNVNAELNYRFAQVVFILLLPFLAVATVIEPRRNPSPFRFFIGLLLFLVFNQYLSMGRSFSRSDILPPIVTIWLPVLIMTVLVLMRFYKIAYRPAFKTAR